VPTSLLAKKNVRSKITFTAKNISIAKVEKAVENEIEGLSFKKEYSRVNSIFRIIQLNYGYM
jgi:hypothetical protein